jgi:hypothetical protein
MRAITYFRRNPLMAQFAGDLAFGLVVCCGLGRIVWAYFYVP